LRRFRAAAAVLALLALTGCASGPYPNRADPFEPLNRGVFGFNDAVDRTVLVPVATAYEKVLPSPVRTGVNNFFANLGDVWNFANSVLQLKAQNSAETFMRLNVNTFFGLGGLIDVASELGIDRHSEDFGQTLGRYGVPSGPLCGAAHPWAVHAARHGGPAARHEGAIWSATCTTFRCAIRCTCCVRWTPAPAICAPAG
jgi:phospholipid-binding lipoprotein MlaA